MRWVKWAWASLGVGPIGFAGCAGGEKPYTAAASVECMKRQAEGLLRPSRAAARELHRGSHRIRIGFVGPSSGSSIGLTAKGGDFEIDLYPSEDMLYFHFTRSNEEASTLLHGYRSNLGEQLGKRRAERLAYQRRNVVVEWDLPEPTSAERKAVESCLSTKPERSPALPRWRPAPVPKRFSGVVAPAKLPALELIPSDAEVVQKWSIPSGGGIQRQVAVQWQRTSLMGSRLDTGGLAVWQRGRRISDWTRVFSLHFPAYRVSRLSLRAGDVTGDRHADLVLFEDMGGSAGCGVYRLLATVRGRMKQLYARRGCFDNTRVGPRGGALVMYDGLMKDPRTLEQIHCCWSVWLQTTMRWQGAKRMSISTSRVSQLPRSVAFSNF